MDSRDMLDTIRHSNHTMGTPTPNNSSQLRLQEVKQVILLQVVHIVSHRLKDTSINLSMVQEVHIKHQDITQPLYPSRVEVTSTRLISSSLILRRLTPRLNKVVSSHLHNQIMLFVLNPP